MDSRNEGPGPPGQRFIQGPPASTSSNVRPPETTISSAARPVLNYSIQTGEEFALEFMRERAISKKPSVSNSSGDQNYTAGYTDFRGVLGISHTGSESGPDVSKLISGDKTFFKDTDKRNLSEAENKGRFSSSRSVPRASSGVSHGDSSCTSDSSSKKMKVLCSFGGKVLPRPSDGKLRYVGGDTRIIRISKDISWQELMQKTTVVYNQPHTIKYQLPGEDLDALVSVCCDEDLQNMIEECSVLDGREGSQKLRMFLFSSSDFDDFHYGLGSMDGDSEIQYMVAVNGIDPGTGKTSSDHGFASTSASDLDQLLNLKVEIQDKDLANRAATESAGIRNVASGGGMVTSSTLSSPLQASLSTDYDPYMHSYQAHKVQYVEGTNCPFSANNAPGSVYNTNSRISVPGYLPSDYNYNSQSTPLGGNSVPLPLHGLLPAHHGMTDELHGTKAHEQGQGTIKESKSAAENMRQRKKESELVQSLENELGAAMQQHEDSVSDHDTKHQEPATLSPSVDDVNADQHSQFHEDDHYAAGVVYTSGFSDYDPDTTSDLTYNYPPSRPARVFHSERIPREQAELLSRHSKSDDSLGSQYLILQSQSRMAPECIAEAADSLLERNMVSESGKSSAAKPPLPSSRTIEDGLPQFDKYKELAGTITQTKKVEPLPPPDRLETTKFALQPAGETVNGKGNFKEPHVHGTNAAEVPSTSVGMGSSIKQQENPVSVLPEEIHWEEITDKAAMEQAAAFAWPRSGAVSEAEPSQPKPEKRDILIDINDRFPPDLLSDIFSKATIAEGSSGLSPLRADDTGISVNMQNHEPKRWSFFRNLAQDEFARKDVSLMDQDHISYSGLAPKVEDGVPRPYQFAPSENEGVNLDHMDSQIDFDEENQGLPGTIEEGSKILHPGFMPAHPHSMDKGGESLQVENPFPKIGENLQTTDSAYEDLNFAIGEGGGSIDASASDIDLSDLQIIMNEDLEELRELGSGTFGTVYHGKWRGSDVAIKRIKKSCFTGRSSEQERLTLEFWREAVILSKLHHPNVVAFYGVVKDGPGATLATVTEFMVNGSLRHVLLRKDKYLDRRKRLIIAMDAAFGMEYLHSKNIVHFDLKCDNLLVNLKDSSRPICKVGDFGLSKIKRNTLVSGGVRGTLPWMAPELLNGGSNKVSEKVDVFSFGIVMWEILTGEEPYANMHYGAIIGGIVNNTLRPPVPVTCDPEWKNLMEQCWAPDPHHRPSFTQIASRLRSMASKTKPTK
ncbi:uncharacterized protein M6B38_369540 [Iris pallida]|uniref:Protein kinase domain-containing protein n=1 Tax=Iris pallida TaxID=29817 RepID=A0AAX6GE00_IRIPA|nr:uncharacterized protein M6B38_369540 [Iris pallida]